MTKPLAEKLANAVALYEKWAQRAALEPHNQAVRRQAINLAAQARSKARAYHLPAPVLSVLVEMPNPKRPGPPARATPAAPMRYQNSTAPLTEKAGPGPYQEPTAEQIVHMMPPSIVVSSGDAARVLQNMKEVIQAHQPSAASTADLDARDHNLHRRTAPELFAAPSDALESLRRIRRDTWLLLAQIADLAPEEREPFRPGLEAIRSGVVQGLGLLDEPPVSAAG